MRNFLDSFTDDQTSITKKYDLSDLQRQNANYNPNKLQQALHETTEEYKKTKKTVDLIHQDKNHVITKKYKKLVSDWDAYHRMLESKNVSISEKEKQANSLVGQIKSLQERHEEEEKSDIDEDSLNEALPPYLSAYKKSIVFSLEITQFNQKLIDLDLPQLQADNYRQRLKNLNKSVRKAQTYSTTLGEKAELNDNSPKPLVRAWNHWIDLKGYHSRAKRFETTSLGLEKIVAELEKQQPIALQEARRKNIKEYEAQCFIIKTLTDAYDNIDRLSQAPKTQEEMQFQMDMASDLQKLEQYCQQLSGSGNEILRYVAAFFWLLAAVVVVTTVAGLGLYLGGGVGAALVVSALTAAHLYPALISLAAMAGCSMALVTPLALGIGGGLAVGVFGVFGSGFNQIGKDKNLLSRSARQASELFLEVIAENNGMDSKSFK